MAYGGSVTAKYEQKLEKLAALHRWETVYLASWLRRAGIPGGVQTYYLAEKAKHPWFSRINTLRLELGKSALYLAKGGVYIEKHRITVSRELAAL